MTAQALPPSLDQQLADARTATMGAEQKAAHWQGVSDDQRKEIDALAAANISLWSRIVAAQASYDALREAIEVEHNRALDAERQLAELAQFVGAETPIAALTLAETWYAEKAHMQERIKRADCVLSDMVNQYMGFPEGYITHEFMSAQENAIEYLEDIGWLWEDRLERYYWTDAARSATGYDPPRVSPTDANPEISPIEETRGAACPRCGRPLNNLSPGISVVAGGIDVCTSCLNPGETEIARAKGL